MCRPQQRAAGRGLVYLRSGRSGTSPSGAHDEGPGFVFFPCRRPLPGGDGQPQHLVSSIRRPLNRPGSWLPRAHPPPAGLEMPSATSLAFPEGRESLGFCDVTSPVLGSAGRTGTCCQDQLSGLHLGEVGVGGHGHGRFGTWRACAQASDCKTQLLGSPVPSPPWRKEEDRLWGYC